MSVHWTLMDVLRHVPMIHLGASHVHAMPAILSMLMAKLVMVGRMYTPNSTTTQNETSLCFKASIHTDRQASYSQIPSFHR